MKLLKIPRFRPYFSFRILKRILTVIIKGDILEGPHLGAFEKEFARYIGRRYAIAVPSGRMALYLSLFVLNIRENDEIILPAYTAPEVVSIIRCAGAIPRFTDINSSTHNMDPISINKNLNKNVRAILLTHLYGKPCDVGAIMKIAEKNNLEVIEDAAQACGAEFKGKKTGTFGRLSYFSFGLVKNFNTLGGGMLATDDEKLAATVRSIIQDYPYPEKFSLLKKALYCLGLWCLTHPLIFTLTVYPLLYLLDVFGRMALIESAFDEKELALKKLPLSYKKKFTNLQAAIGIEQLKTVDELNRKRMKNAQKLQKELAGIDGLKVPSKPDDVKDICLNLVVQAKSRDAIISKLLRNGIDTTKGYLNDCSGMSIFKEFNVDCPIAKSLSERGFYLPIYPFLSVNEIMFIIKVVRERFHRE